MDVSCLKVNVYNCIEKMFSNEQLKSRQKTVLKKQRTSENKEPFHYVECASEKKQILFLTKV